MVAQKLAGQLPLYSSPFPFQFLVFIYFENFHLKNILDFCYSHIACRTVIIISSLLKRIHTIRLSTAHNASRVGKQGAVRLIT